MQISNNNASPAFSGIKVNTSKMNQAQRNLSNRIADILSYSDEYQKASDCGVDVYFLPTKGSKSVKVAFMDTFSDNFYRKSPKMIVQNTVEQKENPFKKVDDIIANLKRILAGEFTAPEFDAIKMSEGKTDLAKLRPEITEEIMENSEKLRKFMDEDDVIETLAESHVRVNQNLRNEGKIQTGEF